MVSCSLFVVRWLSSAVGDVSLVDVVVCYLLFVVLWFMVCVVLCLFVGC